MCATVWRHLVIATEVTAGQVESNGSLLPGGWLKVTCGLTACTQPNARLQVLENFTFLNRHMAAFRQTTRSQILTNFPLQYTTLPHNTEIAS